MQSECQPTQSRQNMKAEVTANILAIINAEVTANILAIINAPNPVQAETQLRKTVE